MTNKIFIVKRNNSHVSNDVIEEFRKTISFEVESKIAASEWVEKLFLRLYKRLPNFSFKYDSKIAFYMLMGVNDFNNFFYEFKKYKRNVIYIYDAWPINYDYIASVINGYHINALFVSSLISSKKLRKLINPNCIVEWIPEAINAYEYKNIDYDLKDIDVLQFGRKYDKIQGELVSGFNKSNISYMYEKMRGEIVFNTREEFISGLSRSKISLCFPRSLTHPEIAKGVETMTIRYLQSMASKALVVGKMPYEMNYLFDKDAVVDLDLSCPAEHIQYLLSHYNEYIPIIEKNYELVLNCHQWSNRWSKMKESLKKELSFP